MRVAFECREGVYNQSRVGRANVKKWNCGAGDKYEVCHTHHPHRPTIPIRKESLLVWGSESARPCRQRPCSGVNSSLCEEWPSYPQHAPATQIIRLDGMCWDSQTGWLIRKVWNQFDQYTWKSKVYYVNKEFCLQPIRLAMPGLNILSMFCFVCRLQSDGMGSVLM